MTTRRFSDLPEYAFPRLRALLAPHEPGGPEIAMSIGEPQHALPSLLAETLAQHAHLYNKYPPIDGTPGWRDAVGTWLTRRFDLPSDSLHWRAARRTANVRRFCCPILFIKSMPLLLWPSVLSRFSFLQPKKTVGCQILHSCQKTFWSERLLLTTARRPTRKAR